MKHEVSTYKTKRALADSLKKAMQTKPFSKITVSEIIGDCGVNRKTFYYHFSDIYALLKWMFEEEAFEVVKHFDFISDTEEAISFVMDYVEQNDHILNCAHDAIGSDELKRFFIADFLALTESVIDRAEANTGNLLEPGYKEFLCHFYVGAVANMLTEWIKNRDKRDRQAIINYFTMTIQGSILGISQLRENQQFP